MKLISVLVLIFALSFSAAAQNSMGVITYQISFPIAESKDFIQKTSFRGFGVEGRHFMQQNLSLGLSLDWNVFHEATNKLIELDQTTISGNQNRIINAFPIMATAHYYLNRGRNDMSTFFGLGAGTYRVNRRLELGVYTLEKGNWHFGLAPEIGFLIPIGFDSNVILSVKYNYAFEADNYSYEYWGLKIGFASITFF